MILFVPVVIDQFSPVRERVSIHIASKPVDASCHVLVRGTLKLDIN